VLPPRGLTPSPVAFGDTVSSREREEKRIEVDPGLVDEYFRKAAVV
jgi:hypothetical protein